MKKPVIIILLLFIFAVVGGAFYYFSGKEYVYRFTESQIQEKLSTKLPFTRTFLFIFQVTLDHPRVSLANNSQRMSAGLDVVLDIRVGNDAKPLGGTLDVSGGIKYVPERGEFFLTDPVIERLVFQGIPDKYLEKVNLVLARALTAYFAERPIYALSVANTKQLAARLVLKRVVVENHELVVTLGI